MKVKLDANDIRLILESDKSFLEEVQGKILASAMQNQLRVTMDSNVLQHIDSLVSQVAIECGLKKSSAFSGNRYSLTDEMKKQVHDAFEVEIRLLIGQQIADYVKEAEQRMNVRVTRLIREAEKCIDDLIEEQIRMLTLSKVNNMVERKFQEALRSLS